jgi:hypothetical protein
MKPGPRIDLGRRKRSSEPVHDELQAKPPRGRRTAWLFGFVCLAAPSSLFTLGGYARLSLWGPLDLVRVAPMVVLVCLWVLVCARARTFLPLTLVIALPFVWRFEWQRELTLHYPCWRYSNADWCGHFCDDDPCACPARDRGGDVYGGGPGCHAR